MKAQMVLVSNELRRGGHPSGDGGGARASSTRTLEGEVDRKVVGEGVWRVEGKTLRLVW